MVERKKRKTGERWRTGRKRDDKEEKIGIEDARGKRKNDR